MARSRHLANGLIVSALAAFSMVVAAVPSLGAVGPPPTEVVGAGLDYTPPGTSPFVDVPTNHQFYTEIAWLAEEGISTGWTVGDTREYRPAESIARDAMAAFLYRFAGEPAFTPPTTSPFTDVTPTTAFYLEITWLAEQGITRGYADGGFHPWDPINRDAMAAFLYRFAGEPAFTPPTTSPFTDVTPTTAFYHEITWLASTGITTGYPDGTFLPGNPVARDAMAAFLYRFAGMLQPEITTTSLPGGTVGQSYTATLEATDGTTPYTWEATGLPTGLTLTGDTITGTPTSPGTASVTITLTDDAGRTDTAILPVEIADGEIDCDVLRCIALTFDDGPAVYTDQVLDALVAAGARATFFLSGNLVQGRHQEVERMADLGMEIGNHSFDHIFLTEEDEQEVYWQLFDTNYWIEYYTGIWPSVFRPPYGYRNTTVDAVAGDLDMAVILWTDDPFDYEYALRDADDLRRDVVDLASRDAVILLHDDVAATAAAIPGIIEDLQDEGYVLVTVTDLIGEPVPGEVYYDW